MEMFETAAHTDPHFIVGVGNYAQGLNDSNRPKDALKWTNGLLSWIFTQDDWRGALRTKKLKAFTPEVNRRLRTNGGNPDWKALGWFISTQAGSYSRLKQTADALEVEKFALLLAPNDARIHFAYGQLIIKFDRPEAIQHWEYALKLLPRYAVCAAALAHERLVDGRYKDTIKLLEPLMESLGWNSEAWMDLSDAKAGLHDFTGAAAALDGAEKSVFVKKEEIAKRRRKLKELQDAYRASRATSGTVNH
jgi:predicted Zn-dependent protease